MNLKRSLRDLIFQLKMEKTLPRGAGGFSERDCREDKWCDTPRREGRRERNGVRHPVTGHVATFQVRSKLGTVNSPDGTLFRTPLGAFFQRSRKEEGRLKTLAACRNSGITFLPPSFLAGFKLIKPGEGRESIFYLVYLSSLSSQVGAYLDSWLSLRKHGFIS